MAKKNSLDLSGIDLSSLNNQEEAVLDLSGIDLSSLSNQEELSKKKVQEEEPVQEEVQEEVQEDTESPSEDISLESSSTDEKPKEFKLPEVRSEEDELFKRSKGYYPGEQKSFYQNKEKEGAVATNDAFTEVSEYKGVFLDTPEEDLTDSLYEASDYHVRSDIAQAVSKKRTEELNTLADTFLDEEKKSIAEGIVEDNPEIEIGAAEAMASDSLFQETFKFGMSKLNLNEEDLATYKTDIENRSKDLKRRSELINKINKINSQIKSKDVPIEQKREFIKERFSIDEELKRLKESVALSDKKIAELRENEKGFTDAEGNVNKELKEKQEDIGKRVSGFEKEYKSDYNKIYARLAQEKAKQDALKNALLSKLSPDLYQALGGDDEVIEQKINSVFSSYGGLDVFERVLSRIEVSSSNRVGNEEIEKVMEIASSYFNEYKEAEKNSTALSRLIFLNEDPAKVERGFGAVNPESEFYLPFQEELGQVVTSLGETLAEEFGVDITSDKDFRERAINMAQQENLTLTPEQIESGNASFPEKLGDGLAISLKIGAEIALTRGIMGGASKLVSMPKYLARVKILRNSPKLVKFIEGTADVLLEGLSFELASESTDFAMGSAESLSNKGMDALVKRVSKSKLGKYFKFLDNYAGRFVKEVTGRASGGIIEEYTGDFVSEGVKNGFFTEEQFKNVFGEGEAGMEKFFLTLGTVGMMTVPTSIVTAAKKKAAGGEEGGELSKAIKRYEESLEINPTKENVAEGLEVLKEADSKVVEGITKEEEKVLTQKTKEDGKKEEVSIEDQKDGDVENEEEAKSEQEVVQEEVLEPTSDTTTEVALTSETVTDKKGRTLTYFENTETKDNIIKTTYTFNRSDKNSSQRNTTGVKPEVALDNKGYEVTEDSTPVGAKINKVFEVRVDKNNPNKAAATVEFISEDGKNFRGEITLKQTQQATTDTTTEEEVAEEEVLENDLDIPEVQKELTEDEVKINSVNSLVKEYNSSKNKNKKSKLFQEINSKSSNLNLTIKTKDNGKIELLNKSGKLVRSKSVKKKFKDQPESDVNAVKKAIEVGILSDVKNTDYILPGISSGDVLKGIRDFSRGKFNTEPAKALTIAFRNARNQNEIGLREKFSNAVKSDPKSVSLEEFNQELELESEEVLADQASRQVPQEAQDSVVSSVEEFAKEEGIEVAVEKPKAKPKKEVEPTREELADEEWRKLRDLEDKEVKRFFEDKGTKEITSDAFLEKAKKDPNTSETDLKFLEFALKLYKGKIKYNKEFDYKDPFDSGPAGMYDYETGDIIIFNEEDLTTWFITHEAIHGITQTRLQEFGQFKEDFDPDFSKEITRLFEYAKKNLNQDEHYGLTNIHEFVAEAFGNPDFRAELGKIRDTKGAKSNVFSSFVKAIKNLFKSQNIDIEASVLESIIKATEKSVNTTLAFDGTKKTTTTKEVEKDLEGSFTKEEMTSKMDKTSLEKALEKVNALDNKLKNLSLSDPFLITPAARLLLAAVKKGMKVGISLEKVISNAKKQIVKSKEYKVLRKEDQNFIDNSSLDDIISRVEQETKGDSAKKKLLKNQGFSDSEIEQILLDFENKKKAAAVVKKATVKGKPTKTVVRKNTGQSAPPKISVTEKSIVKRIIQAQNKAGKQTLKNKVSLFRELAKELGYKVIPKNINTRKAISLMRELNGLDATNSKKVKSFVERLDKTLSDTEESNRKSELSKRVKRISKLGKKTKGVRSDIANRLKNLNLNKIEDIETYNKLVQALEDSFKIKESMAEKSITPESLDAINKLEQEQEQTNEMILKDSYENSVLKAQGLTFEEYKHIQKRAGENAALALKKQALDTKQKNLQEKIDEFNNQIERFEAYADSVDSQDVLSESYKEAVRKLRKALKGVDVNSLSDNNINSIYNATEEMINYDSPAGVTQITNILIGSKKGQSLFTYSKSKGGIFSKTGSLAWKGLLNTNWENFISGVTKKISYAQEFTAKLMAEWDIAQAKANSRVTPLEERLNTISERKKGFVNIGVDSNGFQKIGVVSELLQHDSGITEQEIEQDFKDKKLDIKKNILVDRRIMKSSLKYSPEYNAASRRSKILQETLDTVNKYDSKADLQAAVDKGEILSKPELEYFNTVKEMFAELQPELRESLYMNTGQDLKMVENYTPTYKKTYSKVSDIEKGSYSSTLSSSQSTGRTIQRVKPTGNTYNNYDFRETSLSGLRDVISDIETLPAKAQTNAVLNSKGYNKMFPKGSSLQASIESYLENIAKARESRSPADFSQQNRVSNAMRNLYSSLVAIPLKNTGQYIKQTVPIVTNTVFVNGVKKVSQAIMLMNSKDPAIQAKLEEAYSRSQTKNRTTLGDAQLDKSKSLMAKLLKNAYSPEGKGNIVSKGYSRLVEGALSIGDAYAARLTFVSSMLVELEKQGIDFDSDISNETISKADFTTNQINNTSDYTKTKQAFKGKSKNDKIIKDLLFLYKSFAMNQSATIANAIPKILRGDRQAIGLAVGSSVGLYTFHLIATMMRSAEKDLAEDLFGFNDDEIIDLVSGRSRKKRKKLFDKKDTKEEREREKLFSDIGNKTIVDFTTGWMPGIVDNLVKRSINLLADQFVSENRRLELEDMGIKKEDFIKIYDQDPGVLGLLSGQTGDVVNAISIIRNPDLDEKFKKPAYALLTSLILQEGNINKISKKLIYQSVKADKAIRKELNK